MAADDGKKAPTFRTKKCYECFTHVALDAEKCPMCHTKLGKVNKIGIAAKPVNWKAYLLCAVSWIALGVFLWIGFR